jgi:hypothetical protein
VNAKILAILFVMQRTRTAIIRLVRNCALERLIQHAVALAEGRTAAARRMPGMRGT